MGAGIAVAFAAAGTLVSLTTRRRETLDRARRRMEDAANVLAESGMSDRDPETILGLVTTTTAFDDVDFQVDLIVESVAEDPELKRELLRRAEAAAAGSTVITTNTSSLPLGSLSSALKRPERFAGYHWFNPPELLQLVEVVSAEATAAGTMDRLTEWSIAIGKKPVSVARDVQGFVANRLQYSLIREAYSLVEAGVCGMADVDRVIRAGLGPRWAAVGPFESMDLAGLDVHLEVARRLFPVLSTDDRPPQRLERLVARGALGAKAGEGLYGGYDASDVERLVRRRTATLLALAALERSEAAS
jgi:3-hydroxybutyryl-CoA dehydrogenase